ncbi:FtsW/RodA/SpoVE family cell cycle protein [Bacillus sp. AFS017336]|uniref:FtsW/RodA/SpoVE family cell cycle protein n=1 Tax=Bacillus sp. AFS017336 TaxID=2033489 RepID=UPI000BEFCE26|nr:FtsW/RodA/SpoVE family cell cycle protein [Bacillus sp. AFS017336]PEL05864.1 cell division protein FtsW [Bacillus sp. AFS017336]
MNPKNDFFKFYDFIMLILIFCLMITSIVSIYSASKSGQYQGDFVIRQSVFYLIGLTISIVVAIIDIDRIKKINWMIYGICVLLLIVLMFAPESIAKPKNGAKAWFQLPIIGSLQPSEFMKISLILSMSALVDQHYKIFPINNIKSDLLLLGKISLISLPPALIVLKQPDTGMTIIFLVIIFSIVLCSKIKASIVVCLLSIPSLMVSTLLVIIIKFPIYFEERILSLLMPHQRSRITGWLDPFANSDAGFQTKQGLLAIGTGQFSGKGYLNGTVYIPEAHTDFIFANIGEEFGFIGGAVVITLFFLFLSRIINIALAALKNTNNLFGSMICVGTISVLAFQIFQNIGMTIGLLPVTGITLPFISYGGSSLLSNMILIGIVQSVRNSYSGYIFYHQVGGKYG